MVNKEYAPFMKNWYALQLGDYIHKYRIQALCDGVRELGGEVVVCRSEVEVLEALELYPVTVGFTSGMRENEAESREVLQEREIPLLVADCGYFQRANDNALAGYNQLGIGGLCWTPPTPMPSDRYDKLGMPEVALPKLGSARNCLILGQVAGDAQHGLKEAELAEWLRNAARAFDKPAWRLRYRPHPRGSWARLGIEDEVSRPQVYSLDNDLDKADYVITYNSTGGLEAIARGLPVICHEDAHYAHISDYGLGCKRYEDVMQYFYNLAYSQWTIPEISSGLGLQFINRYASFIRPH